MSRHGRDTACHILKACGVCNTTKFNIPTALQMKEWLCAQFQNFILWMPFAFAFGAALYFSIPFEPAIKYPFIILGLMTILAVVIIRKRHNIDIRIFTGVIVPLLFGIGFFYAYIFTHGVHTPQIKYDLREKPIIGIVENIDFTNARARIFLRDVIVDGNDTNKLNVRVSTDIMDELPPIGATVSGVATLYKPPAADVPGGFDFAEWAYFKKLSATGFLHDAPITLEINSDIKNIKQFTYTIRQKIHNRIAESGNSTATALADSLVLGFTNAIDPDASTYARAAGIAHVFSISGFHITLVGGWLFAIFYLLIRIIPPITRNVPARIPAMVCMWAGLLIYLGISGAAVATIRAFLMASLGILAFFFNRNVFSLRNVCMVFGILIILNPYYVMQAGFQLSFAAIFGLIYFIRNSDYKKRTILQKVFRAIGIILLTDFIATIFTGPFVAYHFGYIPIYSLLGNLLCLPIFTFLIMPLILIGTITAMFGFYLPLDGAAYFYDITTMITKWIYNLPAAQVMVPPIPGYALCLLVLGFLCVMFLIVSRRTKIHIISGVALAFVLIVAFRPRPVFYASHDHELVAFMTDSGKLQFNKKTASRHRFTFDSWGRINMEPPSDASNRHAIGAGFDGINFSVKCEEKVCYFQTPNFKLAYVQQFVPLYRNIGNLCDADSNLDYIVTYFKIDAPECNAKILTDGLVIYKSGRVKYVPKNRRWHQ